MRSSGCHRGDDRLGTNRDLSQGPATRPRIKTPTREDSHLRSGQGVPKAGPHVETEGKEWDGNKRCKLTKLGKKIASVVGGPPRMTYSTHAYTAGCNHAQCYSPLNCEVPSRWSGRQDGRNGHHLP